MQLWLAVLQYCDFHYVYVYFYYVGELFITRLQ